MGKTKIEWTHQEVDGREIPGYTFNPWIGCMHAGSPGCDNCYAKRQFQRKSNWADCWGSRKTTRRRKTSEQYWKKPLAWNAQAAADGIARRVFCASLADVWEVHPDVTPWRSELWKLIEATPALDWLLLTKRSHHLYNLVPDNWNTGGWPANAWAGVTVENNDQKLRLYHLKDHPAPVRFVSFEPLLDDVILSEQLARSFDWFIVGSESGPDRRPARETWVRHLKEYRRFERPYFFVKQLEVNGRLSRDPEEWPADLRMREVPPPRRVEQP